MGADDPDTKNNFTGGRRRALGTGNESAKNETGKEGCVVVALFIVVVVVRTRLIV